MSKRKNNLDEMQEQKLLKIEHNGMWITFWGLVGVILIQSAIGGENRDSNVIGEVVVLLVLNLYILVACMKNGIWGRKLQANTKTNMILSLAGGMVVGLVRFISSYLKYHNLLGSIATGVFVLISTAVLTFISLTVAASLYKKRVKKLEEDNEVHSNEID